MAVALAPPRTITPEEQATARQLLANARAAMRAVESLDQAAVDRLCRAVAWAGGNERTAIHLAKMSVDESGMGSPEPRAGRSCSASFATRCARRASASSRSFLRKASSSTRSRRGSSPR